MNALRPIGVGFGLLVVAAMMIAMAFPGSAKRWEPAGIEVGGLRPTGRDIGVMESAGLDVDGASASAPEFALGEWINSEPLTLKSLRGRVVLVEFWTFGCYNCRNTLPAVKKRSDLKRA